MRRRGCLLIQLDSGWRVAVAGSPEVASLEVAGDDSAVLASAVVEYVHEHGLNSRALLIALHSQSVMVGSFDPPVGNPRNHTTLSYEFERMLHLDAEEFVAEFIDHGTHVFGVATGSLGLLPAIDELEERGLRVCSVVPATMLSVQSITREIPLSNFTQLIWGTGDWYELVQLNSGRVAGWQHLPADTNAVRRQLTIDSTRGNSPQRIATVGMSEAAMQAIRDMDAWDVEEISTSSFDDHLQNFAESVLAGKQSPWFELRRGTLAGFDRFRSLRSGLTASLVAAALLLVTLCAVNCSAVFRKQQQIHQFREQQFAAFDEVFPMKPVPAAVASRMRSERTKLAGAHVADAIALPTPALNVLVRFFEGLPNDQQGSFRRVRIENGALDAEVDLVSHSAANELAASLRQHGFDIDPPTTTQESDSTVVTRLYANMRSENGPGGGQQ